MGLEHITNRCGGAVALPYIELMTHNFQGERQMRNTSHGYFTVLQHCFSHRSRRVPIISWKMDHIGLEPMTTRL